LRDSPRIAVVRHALALVIALLGFGCASGVSPSASEDDTSASRWCTPEEVLDPRMVTFRCEEDPGRPRRVLDLWLKLLDPAVHRRRGDGVAEIRLPRSPKDTGPDLVIRWRPRDRGLDVQVAPVTNLEGDTCRRALASLALAMEMQSVYFEPAPPSGCAPPEELPPGSPRWRDAMNAEFARMGMVLLDDDPEQGANVARYGPPGGTVEWRVDCEGLETHLPTLELFHETVPFDAKGERDLLARILRRLGVVPWGLYPGERTPSPDDL